MGFMRLLVRFSATPVFILLGAFNLYGDSGATGHMAMMAMALSSPEVVCFGVPIPKIVASALSSMWLMYFAMALFHSSAWLGLLSGDRRRD